MCSNPRMAPIASRNVAQEHSPAGASVRRPSPRTVSLKVPESWRSSTPSAASNLSTRYSDGACVPVNRASSFESSGLSASRSAIRSSAAT